MTKPKGFLQMFAIPPTGGGTGMHLDFHLDTHKILSQTEHGKDLDAKDKSRGGNVVTRFDKDGHQRIYENGNEISASFRGSSNGYDCYPYDNGDQSGHARGDYDS